MKIELANGTIIEWDHNWEGLGEPKIEGEIKLVALPLSEANKYFFIYDPVGHVTDNSHKPNKEEDIQS